MLRNIMRYPFNLLIFKKGRYFLLHESKRYAGHSKWQNIKHTKQANDRARSLLFLSLINKMKVAIIENGSVNPSENTKLAQLVEECKKSHMPSTTLNAFFERERIALSGINLQRNMLIVRGPGKCILLLYVLTDNITGLRMHIVNKLKKANCKLCDPSTINMFDCASYVTAEKDCNLEQAMEDAINIKAEDVEEIQEDNKTYFQFKCEFLCSEKSISQLKSIGYSVISVNDSCVSESLIELNEQDLNSVNRLKEQLLSMNEIEKIEDNIMQP